MPDVDNRKAAQDYATLAITGQYVNEEYPQRLAMLAQSHAILAVADVIEEFTRVVKEHVRIEERPS